MYQIAKQRILLLLFYTVFQRLFLSRTVQCYFPHLPPPNHSHSLSIGFGKFFIYS